MPGTYAELEGVNELLRALERAGGPGARKVMLKSLVEGAKQVRSAIRAEAPVAARDTAGRYAHKRGTLRAGVRYKASRTRRTYQIAYMIGPFGKGTAHRHLVISGHAIKGHRRTLLGMGAGKLGRQGLSGAKRTRPDDFVARGEARSKSAALLAVEGKARALVGELARG